MAVRGYDSNFGSPTDQATTKKLKARALWNRYAGINDLFDNQSKRVQGATALVPGSLKGTGAKRDNAISSSSTRPAGGGGSGGGSGSTGSGGSGGSNTSKLTGFAKRYNNTQEILGMLNSDPNVIQRDYLKSNGYDPNNTGLGDLLAGNADNLQYLQMLMGGGQNKGGANSMDPGDTVNFIANYTKNAMTPGGAGLDTGAALQSILDPQPGSALSLALKSGDPESIASTVNHLVSAATQGMTPLMQRVMMQTLQDRTADWIGSVAKGGKTGISNYLQQGGNGILGM